MFRRGEGKPSAAGAAVLVALIALLIILYMLMLPPQERCMLLDSCVQDEGSVSVPGDSPSEKVIFSAVPDVFKPSEPLIKPLSSFTLKTLTEGSVLASRSGVVVERSVFHSKSEQLVFTLPEHADNILLSFNLVGGKGNLVISLNNNIIFDSPITSRQPDPIKLPASLLLEGDNIIEFSVSGVGFSFWSTNRYELSNILVTADVDILDRASLSQRFVISKGDYDSVQLRFIPVCESPVRLNVDLNNLNVYSGVPDCGVLVVQDLAPSRLFDGENSLTWSINDGELGIDQPEIVAVKQSGDDTMSFVLAPDLLNDLVAQGGDVYLRISFAGQGGEGRILLNGKDLFFRSHKSSFAGPISSYVVAGENKLKILDSSSPITLVEVFV